MDCVTLDNSSSKTSMLSNLGLFKVSHLLTLKFLPCHPTAGCLDINKNNSNLTRFQSRDVLISSPKKKMAYTKIGYGGSYLVQRGVLEHPCGSDHNARLLSSSFPIIRDGNHRSIVRTISASMAEVVSEIEKQRGRRRSGGGGGGDRRAVEAAREKLDRWMKESVTEIVKNLSEAPLLVHLYTGDKEEGTVVVMKAEEWETVKGRWERGEAEMPEGIVFVEQLGAAEESCGCGFDGGDGTRAWGLVVQGKGVECGPVCYLLKTTRVGSMPGSGLGMRSTHFCLAKVSSFRESSEFQLRNCWLVGN